MEYALIKNNLVENVIVADPDFISIIAQDWQHIERIDTPVEKALGVGRGWGWNETDGFVKPYTPEPTPEPDPVWKWYIDIGPFFDRFGTQKLPVLMSSDVGVQALIKDIQIRKWIDLQLPEVAQGLTYIGSVIPAVDETLRTSILETEVAQHENLALRKSYFGA